MCGIAGAFFTREPDVARAVRRTLEAMRYRGPDHLGTFTTTSGSMGNVRLAIQGLGVDGNQPMYNEAQTIAVVFNGEIYNYPELRKELVKLGCRLHSNSDTEILVHLYEKYGIDFASRLNGMFAFAIFDSLRQQLVLARDRSGQKPLFVRATPDGTIFSSELGPLIDCFGTSGIYPEAVQQFLSLGYILEPDTICRDVKTLEPGSICTYRAEGRTLQQFFWQPRISLPSHLPTMEEWLDEAEPIFRRALKRHVLSDVPVTMFLSGGVDSNLVLALAASETKIAETFCGSFADTDDHDEFRFAQNLSNALGLQCQRIPLSEQQLVECLPRMTSSLSQPIGDYSALAMYPLSAAVAAQYKVVLGGDAGDELFGGYPTYRLPGLQQKYGWIPQLAVRAGHQIAARILDKNAYMNLAFQLQQVAQAWGHNDARAHFEVKNFLPPRALQILHPDFKRQNTNAIERFEEVFSSFSSQDTPVRLSSLDFRTFLQSGTIPKVERMTMLHSLEGRMPLLDNEIIDLALRTPSQLRMHHGVLKAPLRQLLKRLWRTLGVPKCHGLNPRKQGFSPPLRKLLEGPLREWRDDSLAIPDAIFTGDLSEQLLSLNRSSLDTHRLEWSICMLKNWLREHQLSS